MEDPNEKEFEEEEPSDGDGSLFKSKFKLKEEAKFTKDQLTWKNFFSMMPSILVIILAVTVGFFVSAKHYQNECNEFVYETYIVPQQEYEGGFLNGSDLPFEFDDLNFQEIEPTPS